MLKISIYVSIKFYKISRKNSIHLVYDNNIKYNVLHRIFVICVSKS